MSPPLNSHYVLQLYDELFIHHEEQRLNKTWTCTLALSHIGQVIEYLRVPVFAPQNGDNIYLTGILQRLEIRYIKLLVHSMCLINTVLYLLQFSH